MYTQASTQKNKKKWQPPCGVQTGSATVTHKKNKGELYEKRNNLGGESAISFLTLIIWQITLKIKNDAQKRHKNSGCATTRNRLAKKNTTQPASTADRRKNLCRRRIRLMNSCTSIVCQKNPKMKTEKQKKNKTPKILDSMRVSARQACSTRYQKRKKNAKKNCTPRAARKSPRDNAKPHPAVRNVRRGWGGCTHYCIHKAAACSCWQGCSQGYTKKE